MFAYLKGVVQRKTLDSVVLEVGGIGYKIHTAASALAGCDTGMEAKFFTHLNVREDGITLYGFMTEEELRMFEQLLTVSGVGPKASLSLVSNISPSQFGLAVLTDDADRLTKAPGIGKKTAQRIILELKDKVKKESANLPELKGIQDSVRPPGVDIRISEAVSALVMLGYSSAEANRAVADSFDESKTVEEIVREALKHML